MNRNMGQSEIVAGRSINGPSVQRALRDDAPHLISCLWEIALLIKRGLVKPLGRPGPNGDKFFATVTLSKLRQDEQWLSRATQAVSEHWKDKNARKAKQPQGGRMTSVQR